MEINEIPSGKKIVLFDGVCNLCDSFVQYIIKRDRKDEFRFVSLQSELGVKILSRIGADTSLDSVVLFEPGIAYYVKSDAAIRILKSLGGVNMLAGVFSALPTFIGNFVYDFVAKNRYKWYGKKDQCMIPELKIKGKFL